LLVDFRAVVFRVDALRAVDFLAVDLRADVFLAVVFLRAPAFFAVDLRAVVLRAVVFFLAPAFFAVDLRAVDLRAVDLRAVVLRALVFLADDFLAVDFLRAPAFFAVDFLAVDFFAVDFLAVDLRAEVFLREDDARLVLVAAERDPERDEDRAAAGTARAISGSSSLVTSPMAASPHVSSATSVPKSVDGSLSESASDGSAVSPIPLQSSWVINDLLRRIARARFPTTLLCNVQRGRTSSCARC
jgi:hypothetical protein